MTIALPDDARARALASLQRFAAEDLDEELGDLRATLLLDFFLQEIAPTVYNRAVGDAQAHLATQLQDLDGTCWEPEFGYWKR